VGSVIGPGAPIMEIVPVDDDLVAEGRLSTRDAGLVRSGQAVTVKVSAWDFARYGTIAGTVTDISASTFLDEQGQPYYKMTVALASAHVGDSAERRVLPGMTVQLDVRTGARTVMDYLLKPVQAALSESLQEH
jgi:HlyD family secretion protein/adhesin transport system membrane fusion protein